MEFLRIASFFGSPDPRMCLSGVTNNQHCGKLLVDASAMIAAVFVAYELLLQKVKKTCAVCLFRIQGWLHRFKKYSIHAKLAAYRAILNNPIVYETNCDEL